MITQLRMPGWARRFKNDASGVSAVEFALLLPLMLTMYLGGSEISQALTTSRKVTLVSRAVADLASQSSKITDASMTNILNASAAVIAPYANNKLAVTVSQVKIDGSGNATVDWSDTYHGTARTPGASVTLPAALKVANTWLIWTEATYTYEPSFGSGITGTLNLADQMYMRPRLSNSVSRTAS